MRMKYTRLLYLAATILIATCAGIIYVFSRQPIDYISYMAASPSLNVSLNVDADHTHIQLTHSVYSSPHVAHLYLSGPTVVGITAPKLLDLPLHTLTSTRIPITETIAQYLEKGLITIIAADKDNRVLNSQPLVPKTSYHIFQLADYNGNNIYDKEDIAQMITNIRNHYTQPRSTPLPTPQNRQSEQLPTLLMKYRFNQDTNYDEIAYRPRSFGNSLGLHTKFAGWDVLNTPIASASALHNPGWLSVTLNRPATVAIIWKGKTIPAWLQTWRHDESMMLEGTMYPVYTLQTTAAQLHMGSPETLTDPPYTVLFAEQEGKPSQKPAVPPNHEEPQSNKPCPDWVHEQYTVKGPDGKMYATWHPAIDPVYWCYFGHEHGSNPALFDTNVQIPFGYAGEKMGMHEAHVGFKTYVWDDMFGYRWLMVQHQGTSSNQAACGRYHELDISSKSLISGDVLSEQYFVGDFGTSRVEESGDALSPKACKDQGKVRERGVRFLPVSGYKNTTEEPWVVNSEGVIGFTFEDLAINTLDSVRICADIHCDQVLRTGKTGTQHSISFVPGFGPKSGKGHEGYFYTDATGKQMMAKDDPMAVKQYIKPGVSIYSRLIRSVHNYLSTNCQDTEGFGSMLDCEVELNGQPTARENSIHNPN